MKSWLDSDTGFAQSAACCGSRTRMLCRSRSERWITSQHLTRAAVCHQCTTQNAGVQHPARATEEDEDLGMVRFRERTVFAPRKDGFCITWMCEDRQGTAAAPEQRTESFSHLQSVRRFWRCWFPGLSLWCVQDVER